MSGEELLPFKGDSRSVATTTKSAIVDILSKEWPLSCRKIYNRLSKGGKSLTYQAIHKAVLQMTEEGKLTRKGADYSLNIDWINAIGKFSREVGEAYSGKRTPKSVLGEKETVTQLNFRRGYDAIDFLLTSLSEGKFVPLDGPRIEIRAKVQHMWNPFVLVPSDFGRIREISRRIDARIICRGDTVLDQVIAKFYGAFRAKVALGCEGPETPEVIVVGDTVIQIFNPAEMRQMVDEAYRKTKSLLSLGLMKTFSDIAFKENEITILINRNPIAAKSIREEVERRVGEKRPFR